MTKNAVQSSTDEKKEIEMLRARLAELEDANRMESTKIPLDEYIPVMSLLPYRLNLSTKANGTGDVKKFSKFGEVKNILYKDLVDILETNSSFMESGFFYILNPAVIRQHGLDEVYSKILTKEKIEEILATNSKNSISLYESANEEQQKVILQLLIDKVRENPDAVNLNTIDKISRISGVNISERVREYEELQELVDTNE